MKPVIADELYTFLWMVILGAGIVFLFDIFRCFRRVLIKNTPAVHISDLLFWATAFLITVRVLYVFSDGRLRFFLILASFLGGLLYFLTLSRLFITLFSNILEIFLKIFQFIFKILLTPVHFLYKILLVAFEGVMRILTRMRKASKDKKIKKRGCRNDKVKRQKEKNNDLRRGNIFGGYRFARTRRNEAARNNP